MKKIITILLTLLMVVSLGTVAFADNEEQIQPLLAEDEVEVHYQKYYKIGDNFVLGSQAGYDRTIVIKKGSNPGMDADELVEVGDKTYIFDHFVVYNHSDKTTREVGKGQFRDGKYFTFLSEVQVEHTIKAYYIEYDPNTLYPITINGNFKAYNSEGAEITEAKKGEVVTIKAIVPEGKKFGFWNGEGYKFIKEPLNSETTFVMPLNGIEISFAIIGTNDKVVKRDTEDFYDGISNGEGENMGNCPYLVAGQSYSRGTANVGYYGKPDGEGHFIEKTMEYVGFDIYNLETKQVEYEWKKSESDQASGYLYRNIDYNYKVPSNNFVQRSYYKCISGISHAMSITQDVKETTGQYNKDDVQDISLSVEKSTPSTEEVSLIQNAMTNGGDVNCYDINLNITSKVNGNNVPVKATELNSPKDFYIELSNEQLDDAQNIQVIRIHGGKAEVIDSYLFGNELHFSTDKFSTYGVSIKKDETTADIDTENVNKVIESANNNASDTTKVEWHNPGGDKNITSVSLYIGDDPSENVYGSDMELSNNKIDSITSTTYQLQYKKDIELNLFVSSSNDIADVKELDEEIVISITLSDDLFDQLKDADEVKVIRIHGTQVDVLNASLDKTTKVLTFRTDKFSLYTIAGFKNVTAPSTNNPVNITRKPVVNTSAK